MKISQLCTMVELWFEFFLILPIHTDVAIHAHMWSWGKTCDSLDAIPSVTVGSCKCKTLMNFNMTLTVLNLHQKTPKGATTETQVKRYERYKRDKILPHIPVER